jgi:uncharacterized protein YbgA (DUF1722 family)
MERLHIIPVVGNIPDINDHIITTSPQGSKDIQDSKDSEGSKDKRVLIDVHYTFLKYPINKIRKYTVNSNDYEIFIQDSEFNKVKNELNTAKDLLDTLSPEKYCSISRQLDEYRTMKRLVSSKYKMQIVTNASLKMYELIIQMHLINKNTINAFCNAELPGGFIIAINHYLKTMYESSVFRWLASSYVSSNALGDTYGIYENNRNNWIMDDSMNGDITKMSNILEIVKRVRSKFINGVDIYTSDAGLDVSSDYNKQEEQTLELNYCQVLIGLLVLAKNGTLVTKQFTFFTQFNRSLITLLTFLFEELYITKPSTSRPINSEIYIIGKCFKGITSVLRNYLLSKINSINPSVPLIMADAVESLLRISKEIYIDVQAKHIKLAHDIITNDKEINIDYNIVQSEWLTNNPMYPINKRYYIKSNAKITYG